MTRVNFRTRHGHGPSQRTPAYIQAAGGRTARRGDLQGRALPSRFDLTVGAYRALRPCSPIASALAAKGSLIDYLDMKLAHDSHDCLDKAASQRIT